MRNHSPGHRQQEELQVLMPLQSTHSIYQSHSYQHPSNHHNCRWLHSCASHVCNMLTKSILNVCGKTDSKVVLRITSRMHFNIFYFKNCVVGCWHGSEVQTCIWPSWCHCHTLSLASVKFRLVLSFWYRLTRVVPGKGPLNVCVCVCILIFSCTLVFLYSWEFLYIVKRQTGQMLQSSFSATQWLGTEYVVVWGNCCRKFTN